MNRNTWYEIAERQPQTDGDIYEATISAVENYLETEQGYCSFESPSQLQEALNLLGVEQKKHLVYGFFRPRYDIHDPVALQEDEYDGTLPFIINEIAHRNAFGDFVNDFEIGLVLKLDEATVVAIRYTEEECPIVCDDCWLNHGTSVLHADYSCEHEIGEYDYVTDCEMLLANPESDFNWAHGLFYSNIE